MTVQSKRHHFTPRYYLKNFQNEKGKLWRLDVETKKIVCGHHNSFGLKKHWNTLNTPPPGYAPDWAEKRISEVDRLAAATLQNLLRGEFQSDLRPLALAMSLMEHHQPKLKSSIRENYPKRVEGWTDDWFLIVGIKAAFDTWRKYFPKLFVILQIPDSSECRFLTSSNPVVSFENKTSMFFPLSNKHCLMMTNDENAGWGESRFSVCSDEKVVGINGLVLRNAWQYVYSCDSGFEPGP